VWYPIWKSGNGHTEIQQRVDQILEEEIESYLKFISIIDYDDLIQHYPSKLYSEKTFRKEQVAVVKDPITQQVCLTLFGGGVIVGGRGTST
jgi:uncharacterized protein (DUF1697 family)